MSSVTEPQNIIYGLHCTCHPGAEIRYIGQTMRGKRSRLLSHLGAARQGKPLPVCNWIRKHGAENIVSITIEDCGDSPFALNVREEFWISEYRLLMGKRLLNVRPGGSNSPLAEVSRRKIGDKARGRLVSAETRQRMSDSQKAAWIKTGPRPQQEWTDEMRAKWSVMMTGKGNGFFGRKHTPESLALMQEGRPDWSGDKNPFYGKTHTPEAVAKIMAANVGRVQSDHERLGKSVAARGEGNPATSLSDSDVVEIHRIYCEGGITQAALGELFGVSQVVVSNITSGRTWKHLELAPVKHNCGRPKAA